MSQPPTENQALGKVAKRGVVWSFLREGVTEVILFPASMLVARLLTPREFGIASAALFVVQLAARLADLGFNAALVRAKTITQDHYSSVFAVNLCIGVAAYLALVAASPYVGMFYNTPEAGRLLPIAALSFLIAPFGAVPGAILARDMRFRESSIVDWNYCLTYAGLTVVFAWLGFSFWGLIYARVASVAAQMLTRIVYARWKPSLTFKKAALKEILSVGMGMHTRRLLEYTSNNVDSLVVGKAMGMSALGLYDKAFTTMNRFLSRFNSGGPGVMFRIFALIHEDRSRFRRAYSRVVMSATLVGFPLLAFMCATAPQLIVVLFGANWRSAAVPLQVLCAAGALKLVNAYASAATLAVGRVWSEVLYQIVHVAIIVVGIALLQAWGPTGAAIAVLVATAVMTVLMHLLLRRVSDLEWSQIAEPLAPGLLCAALGASSALIVERILFLTFNLTNEWALLAGQGFMTVTVCGGFIFFAPHEPLRALVHEMATELAPAFLKRQRWVQKYIQANARYAEASPLG